MIDRRKFLKKTSILTGIGVLSVSEINSLMLSGCSSGETNVANENDIFNYENNLRDRLWMWGHDTGVFDGPDNVYNIPLSPYISMADAIKDMGIPNVCAIRYGIPEIGYINQFEKVKRVDWTMSMGNNETYQYLREYVFKLRDEMPNLTGYYLDDFFSFSGEPNFDNYEENSIKKIPPAALSIREIQSLYEDTINYKRRINSSMVLYTHQLHPSIEPFMKYVDSVALWTWDGADIQRVEQNFNKYRSISPNKQTLLGIYMWDFGGKKEIDQGFMVKQLDFAHKLYMDGEIDGMIFHCTPLVNKNLEAVNYSRKWIAEHGDDVR